MKRFKFVYMMRAPEGGSLVEREAVFSAKDSFDAFKAFNDFAAKELKRPITKLIDVKEA